MEVRTGTLLDLPKKLLDKSPGRLCGPLISASLAQSSSLARPSFSLQMEPESHGCLIEQSTPLPSSGRRSSTDHTVAMLENEAKGIHMMVTSTKMGASLSGRGKDGSVRFLMAGEKEKNKERPSGGRCASIRRSFEYIALTSRTFNAGIFYSPLINISLTSCGQASFQLSLIARTP